MYQKLDQFNYGDYMDPFNLLQLADDTTTFAETVQSFTKKAEQIAEYSEEKV